MSTYFSYKHLLFDAFRLRALRGVLLVRVAEGCPVSKILKGTIKITSEFRTAGTVIDETETTPVKTDQEIN